LPEGIGREPLARSKATAHANSTPLGWAEITHPFHPFRGRRLRILKRRRVSGVDTIIVQEPSRGTLAVPLEWTDQDQPDPYAFPSEAAPILECRCLLALVDLVEHMERNIKKRVDK